VIDIAKIESAQVNLVEESVNLNQLMNELYNTFDIELKTTNNEKINLYINLALPDKESLIKTDNMFLRQILINLLGNAVKFTNEGCINFGYVIKNNKYLEFFVKDTGIGIPKDKLTVIFERFIQVTHPKNQYGGTGLGLAISKGLVKLFGGEIWVESVLEKGSSFYFTIPYKPQKSLAENKEKNNGLKNKYNWKNKEILIVEDNADSYIFLQDTLSFTGAKIIYVENGEDAIRICKENNHIDVVLMDIQLPNMNGYEACKKILKFRHDLPIIAQTAYALSGDKLKCLDAGCCDYLTKPIEVDILLKTLDKYLSS
jgi:CheY-like chemotaxis protein